MLLIRDCRTLKKCPLHATWHDRTVPKHFFFEKKKYKKRYLYKREKENDLWLKKSISLISQMGDLASEAKTFPWTVWRKKVEFSHGTFNGFLALDSVKSIIIPFKFSILKTSYEFYLWLDLFYIHFIHILDLFI